MKKDTVVEAIKRLPKFQLPDQDYPHKPVPVATVEQRLASLEARVAALETRQGLIFYAVIINTVLIVITDTPRALEIIRGLLTLFIHQP
jgi:hypothetical protein